MEADQRKYFLEICSTENITNAAQNLFISRQGLSKSIKNLEDELGISLFTRSKAGVKLTESGKLLLHYLQQEERLWNTLLTDIGALRSEKPEVIRIGMQVMYFGYEQKRSLLAFFHNDPDIRIVIVDGDHDFFWHSIAAGKMEYAFSIRPSADIDVPFIRLSKDTLSILLSVNDPLAQKECIDFENDLSGKTIIQTSPYKNKLYSSTLKLFGVKSEALIHDKDLMLAHVASDNKYFIVQSQHARTLATRQVCAKPLVNAPIEMDSFFVFRPDLSEAAQCVAQKILESFGKDQEFKMRLHSK